MSEQRTFASDKRLLLKAGTIVDAPVYLVRRRSLPRGWVPCLT